MTSCPRCGRYTTAPTHCGADVGQAAVCGCGCRAMAHGYRTASGRNDGACLGLGCGCSAYVESGQKAHEIRGFEVARWEDWSGETDGPDGALTPLPGPDLRVNSTTRGAKADA